MSKGTGGDGGTVTAMSPSGSLGGATVGAWESSGGAPMEVPAGVPSGSVLEGGIKELEPEPEPPVSTASSPADVDVVVMRLPEIGEGVEGVSGVVGVGTAK